MVETMSNLLRSVVALSPADLLPVLYLSLNRLGPPQQGLELGIGDGILLKAVAQATGEAAESGGEVVARAGSLLGQMVPSQPPALPKGQSGQDASCSPGPSPHSLPCLEAPPGPCSGPPRPRLFYTRAAARAAFKRGYTHRTGL